MQTNLSRLLVQCLINNQLFDAALSAMGYTMLGTILRDHEDLVDPRKYYRSNITARSIPEDLPCIKIVERVVCEARLPFIVERCESFLDIVKSAWDDILDSPGHAVVWDSVRIAFIPSIKMETTYQIRLICATVDSKYRGTINGQQ